MSHTFTRLRDLSTWRQISLHAWRHPADPTVYGTIEIDMEKGLRYLRRVRADEGVHATVTHLVAKALAVAIRRFPHANGLIARRRIYLRDTVDIFVQVASEDGEDLSGAKVEAADEKTVAEIAREVWARAQRIRQRQDPEIERTKRLVTTLPGWLMGLFLRFLGFLIYDVGLDLSRFGVVRDQFGSAMVSNVGMFGLSFGLAPLVPFSRAPIVVLVGEVQNRPWADGERVIARPTLVLGCTFDHRFIDGAQAGKIARVFREALEDPERHLVAVPASVPVRSAAAAVELTSSR
jgi:pyruvate/2-oxoglutarate dehydrogenase complex dihydrolipoamide acyltransferase (E2) component